MAVGEMREARVATRQTVESPSNYDFANARHDNAGRAHHSAVSENQETSDWPSSLLPRRRLPSHGSRLSFALGLGYNAIETDVPNILP
jgi:hypothetical protein